MTLKMDAQRVLFTVVFFLPAVVAQAPADWPDDLVNRLAGGEELAMADGAEEQRREMGFVRRSEAHS